MATASSELQEYTAALRAKWSKAIRDRRKELRMTQVELADKCGVTQTAVSTWETGRTDPTPDSRLAIALALDIDANVLFDWPPAPWGDGPIPAGRAPMPRAVAEAALELTEWALAPVVVGSEDLADDELLDALGAAVDALPAKLTRTLNTMLGRNSVPKESAVPDPGARKRRSPGRRTRGRDYGAIRAVIEERGFTVEGVAEGCGIPLSDLTGETTEWFDMLDVAIHIGVPHTRLYDPGTDLKTLPPTPRFFVWPERSHYCLGWSNVTPETLDQTGIPAADYDAVFSGKADGTWLFANAMARATGLSVDISYGMVAPEGYSTHGPEGTLVLERDALRKALTSSKFFLNEVVPPWAEIAPKWAGLMGMTDDEFLGIVNGHRYPTQEQLRAMWRVLDQCVMIERIIYPIP